MKKVWFTAALAAAFATTLSVTGAEAGCGNCGSGAHAHAAGAACPTGSCSTATMDYTVRRGETLSRIAQRQLGATSHWRAIARANSMRAPYLIRPGQVIKLPCVEGSAACQTAKAQGACGAGQAARTNQAGYAAAAPDGQTPTLRQLWERPVVSGTPQTNAPQGAELNREWNSRNNVLSSGIADRIGPPPVVTQTPAPAAPLQAPFGSAAPTPIGTGSVPAVAPVTSGRPDLQRPRPPVVEIIENRP